jgi:hypothetical protein
VVAQANAVGKSLTSFPSDQPNLIELLVNGGSHAHRFSSTVMSTYHGYGVYNSYQQGQRYAQQEPVHTTFARLNTSLWLTAVQWGGPQAYAFQYPKCTGHRKALLIGINYFGQLGQLRGCINDVRNMMAFLHEQYGYSGDDIVMLADDFQYPLSQPTKQNILSGMHWLVKSAQPGDSLFFHFSGKIQPCPGPSTRAH